MARRRRKTPWYELRGEVYYAFWYCPDARRVKRISLGTEYELEARDRFAAFLTAGEGIRTPRTLGGGITVAEVLTDYEREHVEPRVVDKERARDILKHLRTHFGPSPVRDITHDLVSRYCEFRTAGMIGRKSVGPTQRRELAILVAAINRAVKHRRLIPGDVPHIELPDASLPRDRWLTRKELARLFKASKRHKRCYQFVMLAYYTASRKAAIEGLTWFQVDLAAGTIALDKPGARQTSKRRPVVPISPALLPMLREAFERKTTEYVLGAPGSIRTSFQSACKRAGLGNVTPHTLRHTRATHLLQGGIDPWAVAGLLGDTLDTVLKTYGHHCPDHLRAALVLDGEEVAR